MEGVAEKKSSVLVGAMGSEATLARCTPALLALIALCLLAFGNTLQCWFIADDFLPLAYLHHAFNGHLGELTARLAQPWQDPTVQLLYRPVCEVTLILDYLLWRGNAFGWHLTNLFWHVASTVLFYFCSATLIQRSRGSEPTLLAPSLPAFLAAALFAVTPLHCETVAWMIGRVDSVCTTFYLATFLLFILGRRTLSLLAFALALFSKEMAVTLPAVLALYSLCIDRKSLRATLPYWLLLAPYFALRYFILGTPLGGYIGSIGDVFASSWNVRLLTSDWSKVFYPYSNFALKLMDPPVFLLHALYAVSAIAVLARAKSTQWSKPEIKMILFALGWFAVAILPALPVWYLNSSLTGERFLYLGSAALCLLLPALLVAFDKPSKLAIGIVVGFIASFTFISAQNNIVWIKSGETARALRAALEQQIHALPASKQLVLFNTPMQANDEHLFYTSEMMGAMMKPPITREDLSARISFLQPNSYLPEDPVNTTLLRQWADSPHVQFFIWNEKENALDKIAPRALDVDAVDVVVESPRKGGFITLSCGVGDKLTLPLFENQKLYRFGVGERRNWVLASPEARVIAEVTPPGYGSVVSTNAVRHHRPMCTTHGARMFWDVGSVPNAVSAIAEVSKANSFFVHYTRTLRDSEFSPNAASRTQLGPHGSLPIQREGAYRQIRIFAIDTNGKIAGYSSDPITIGPNCDYLP